MSCTAEEYPSKTQRDPMRGRRCRLMRQQQRKAHLGWGIAGADTSTAARGGEGGLQERRTEQMF